MYQFLSCKLYCTFDNIVCLKTLMCSDLHIYSKSEWDSTTLVRFPLPLLQMVVTLLNKIFMFDLCTFNRIYIHSQYEYINIFRFK